MNELANVLDLLTEADCDLCQKQKPECWVVKMADSAGTNQFCVKCMEKQLRLTHRSRKARKPEAKPEPKPTPVPVNNIPVAAK